MLLHFKMLIKVKAIPDASAEPENLSQKAPWGSPQAHTHTHTLTHTTPPPKLPDCVATNKKYVHLSPPSFFYYIYIYIYPLYSFVCIYTYVYIYIY